MCNMENTYNIHSSGILIMDENKNILVGHVYGQTFYTCPKGLIEDNESAIEAAIRETFEEFNLIFSKKDLNLLVPSKRYIRKEPYIKWLSLFIVFVNNSDIDLTKLKCKTRINDNSEHFEIEGDENNTSYMWIPYSESKRYINTKLYNYFTKYINIEKIYEYKL